MTNSRTILKYFYGHKRTILIYQASILPTLKRFLYNLSIRSLINQSKNLTSLILKSGIKMRLKRYKRVKKLKKLNKTIQSSIKNKRLHIHPQNSMTELCQNNWKIRMQFSKNPQYQRNKVFLNLLVKLCK
jgi:hypothetical protein